MTSPGDALADAFARHQKGDLAAADRIYRKVVKSQPGNADALYLLGVLCLETDRIKDSQRYLRKAVDVAIKADRAVDPGWRLALGAALQRTGEGKAALGEYETALRDDPTSADAMFCRATALQDLGQIAEAVAGYETVLARAPKHAEAANNLGTLHRDRGEPMAAVAAFRQAVAARPGYIDALCNLGRAMADLGWAAEAVPVLVVAADARPDEMDLHLALFDCLVQADRADEAERRARGFLEAHPDSAPVAAALGTALQYLGRSAEARDAFLSATAADPGCSRAHQGLADDETEVGRTRHMRTIQAVLDGGGGDNAGASGLYFALGRHLAAAGRHEESLAAYVEANALKAAVLTQRGFGYSRRDMARRVDALCTAFPVEAPGRPGGDDSNRPVFIVGMPRSGTTLTEQILASHPKVFGAGELGCMSQAAETLRRRSDYPRAPLSGDALTKAAAYYLGAIGRLDDESARVTDKMPGNFLHLGLIAQIFPNARIIHCRRNPIDTCLSCFQQNFRAAHMSWSCDLADLGDYYCQYQRIMEHWRRVLPRGRMLEVDYEDTVADLETQARRLVEFTGLDWDDACLRFYETDRAVVTASHSQVRRKVYASSVGRWKRYGDGLQPLTDTLSGCGWAPETRRP